MGKVHGLNRNRLRSCVSLYLLLLAGYVGGFALDSMFEHARVWISSEISLLDVLALVLAPVVVALIGPFCVAAFACYLLLVRGGTPLAWVIFISSGLIYIVLLRIVCLWFAASSKVAKCLAGFTLIAYSALATMSLMFVAQRM